LSKWYQILRGFRKSWNKQILKVTALYLMWNPEICQDAPNCDQDDAFLTLAPPSRYALNLKALIKLSKVSWTSQLSYEILRSSLERKFDKKNFKLGSVAAGPVIQANGRLTFEDDLRSGGLLYFTTQWTSVRTELADSMVTLGEPGDS